MKEKGAYLVPTLVAPGDVIEGAMTSGGLPPEMIAKAERIGALHRAAVSAAIASGVKIAMGTDAAVGPHGANLRELGEMVRCGMTPMQAIVASTRVPADLLRRPDLGTLAPASSPTWSRCAATRLRTSTASRTLRISGWWSRMAGRVRLPESIRGSALVGVVAESSLVGRNPPGGLLAEQPSVAERREICRVQREAGVDPGDQQVERAPAREHAA